ncbi:hypothetical protein K502DRAFT_47660 [Neoconidiobolus thromboides FSU 785]|nr:hypothetical protein K502DRAFT_47660 [Neoconidiobolus thromboides FSU 785]
METGDLSIIDIESNIRTNEIQEEPELETSSLLPNLTQTQQTSESSQEDTVLRYEEVRANIEKPSLMKSHFVKSYDGVFFNMAAKPERSSGVPVSIETEEEPVERLQDYEYENGVEGLPNYDQALTEPSPPSFNFSSFFQERMISNYPSEPIINGLPVGTLTSFVFVLFAGSFFQFIGFFIAYIIHFSHATKQAALAGLGVTFLQYGFYLFYKMEQIQLGLDSRFKFSYYPIDPSFGKLTLPLMILSYCLLIIGWCFFLNASYEFIKVCKLRYKILNAPPSHITTQINL